MEGIAIQKTTLLAFAGLVLAVAFGAIIVFSSPGTPGPDRQAAGPVADAAENGVAGGYDAGPQDIYIRALSNGGYDRQEITVNGGVPVRLHFSAEPNAGCGRQLVIYGLGVQAVSRSGEEAVVDFTPEKGVYEYNCGMRMWRPGKLVVV